MSTLADQVRMQVQSYLSGHEEDAAWLSGTWGAEAQRAYENLLRFVWHKLKHQFEWREWLERQAEVAAHVRSCMRTPGLPRE